MYLSIMKQKLKWYSQIFPAFQQQSIWTFDIWAVHLVTLKYSLIYNSLLDNWFNSDSIRNTKNKCKPSLGAMPIFLTLQATFDFYDMRVCCSRNGKKYL